MKKQLSTLLIIIGFLLNSCNDTFMHESSSNLATQQQQEISSSKLSIIGIDFDEYAYKTNMEYQSYITSKISYITKQNSEIFGKDILVLPLGCNNINTDKLPTLINQLQYSESICELRNIYEQYNFYSPIIESHILLDSLITSIEGEYKKYNLEDEEQYALIENQIHNKLIRIIKSNRRFSQLISIYDKEDSNTCIVEPIGTIGFRALGNDKNMFIIGTNINKFYDEENAILSVPIDVYIKNHDATYDEWIRIKNKLLDSNISITSTLYAPMALTRGLLEQIYTSGSVSNTDADGKYTLEISYTSRYYQTAPYIIAECPITVRCFGGIKSKTHMNVAWTCHMGLIVGDNWGYEPWNGWRAHNDAQYDDQLYTRSFTIPGLTVMGVYSSIVEAGAYPAGAGFRDISVHADCWKDITVILKCPQRIY